MVHSAASGSVPTCAVGDEAATLQGPKFSPNLAKWVRRHKFGSIPLEAYRDLEGVVWLGWIDEDRWFIGQRLWRILTLGLRAQHGCWTFPVSELTQIDGFWSDYARVGRCAIDTDHSRGFIGGDTRWLVGGDTRTCTWCGHRQRRHQWTETVTRERWVAADDAKALGEA